MKSKEFLNLTVPRAETPVWEWRDWQRYLDGPAVLRFATMAGAGLLAYGALSARQRATSSLWWVVSGAGLLGYAAVVTLRGRPDLAAPDLVTQESLDSFPASDAPSSNATTATPRSL
jgi:hypothetical protein